jgi:rhodanese-related sulfurtransferase
MEYSTYGIAISALVIALIALVRSSRQPKAGVEDLTQDLRRRMDNQRAELEQELALQRRMLMQLASGAKLTREMIEEGRLWQDIDSSGAQALMAKGGLWILDVRTPGETRTGIIPGAQLIPVDELEARVKELPRDSRPKLIYCAAGGRSAAACEFLSQQGFESLLNLEGGFSAWTGPRTTP